jgi:hypothetical protein
VATYPFYRQQFAAERLDEIAYAEVFDRRLALGRED